MENKKNKKNKRRKCVMGGFNYNGEGATSSGLSSPSASDVANQFNSFGGTQIRASDVSNIRSDGNGGY
ncbi:hypothetical protein, partial [Enterobacter hormaechei]